MCVQAALSQGKLALTKRQYVLNWLHACHKTVQDVSGSLNLALVNLSSLTLAAKWGQG